MKQFFNFFQQNQEFTLLSILLLISFLIFLVSWLKEPRRLLNGVLFTCFILVAGAWFVILVLASKLHVLIITFDILLISLLTIITFIVTLSWLFCLWNAYFVWKRESHTLPNLLTLIIGILLILIGFFYILRPDKYLPSWLQTLLYAAPCVGAYLGLVLYNFLINLLLYQITPRHYNQDYLIVLGAGLVNGKTVTPLLASRINRAIQFADKQVAKGKKMPKFIMTGGKGPDEKITEARAMAEYAQSRGISSDKILLEGRAKNTYQNMKFSTKIAQEDYGSLDFKAKFFTNNYHTFRAALYAKKAGLKANGIGSYTRFYFLPNAIVREFAGVFVMHKKRHFLIISLIIIIFILLAINNVFNFIHF